MTKEIELILGDKETPESFIQKLKVKGLKFKEDRVILDLERPNFRGKKITVLVNRWTNEIDGYKLQAPPDAVKKTKDKQ